MGARSHCVLLVALVLLWACEDRGAYSVALETLPVPAGPHSLAPAWTRTPEGVVFLSWQAQGETETRLRFARLEAGGWSEPGTVAAGSNWFVNWADFPSLHALDSQRLVAHWLERSGPGTYAYDIQLTRSSDGGRTWQPLGKAHDDGVQTEHGFVAFYPYLDSAGARQAGLVWLDGRHMDPDQHHGGMSLRHARLSAGGAVSDELELDPLVCDCCQTAAVSVGDDVLVAYRDRSETEIRDIRLLRRSDQGWRDEGLVHADGWEIPGCPVNGPALAATRDRVAIAWFTAAGGEPRVRAAISGDDGQNFSPVLIDDEQPAGRVDVAILEDFFAVSWVSKEGGEGQLRLQLFDFSGRSLGPPQTLVALNAGRASGFPRLLALEDALLLAWTEVTEELRQVRTARLTFNRR